MSWSRLTISGPRNMSIPSAGIVFPPSVGRIKISSLVGVGAFSFLHQQNQERIYNHIPHFSYSSQLDQQ